MIGLLARRATASDFVINAAAVVNNELAPYMILLKTGAAPGKFGIVTVLNSDGTLNREYKITSAQLAALHASVSSAPEGCSQAEWESGRVVVAGWDHDVGDMTVEADGSLVVKFGEIIVAGRFISQGGRIAAAEWSGTPPQVTITQAGLDSIPGAPVKSCVNGILETK